MSEFGIDEWAVIILLNDNSTSFGVTSALNANEACESIRRKMTIEESEQIAEIRVIKIRDMPLA